MRIRRGWKSRRRRPRSRRTLWIVVLVIAVFAVFEFFQYVEKHMREPIIHLAQIRVKQIATDSINDAIAAQVANEQQVEDLIDWKTDDSGKITGFMLNYSAHMKVTSETIQTVRRTVEDVSRLSEHIPLGQALGSPILASFGPSIPIKIEPKGDVKVDLNTRRQDAGINMILVEVFLRVKTELAVVVPFDMQSQIVETEIPVSYLLVVGDVPMYYYDSKGNPVGESQANAPNIALPSLPGTEEKLEQQLPDGLNSGPGNDAVPEADSDEPDAPQEPAENTGQNAGNNASSH
ncbi:sporulation protein YunB [Paenibacillus macerans]|uniref:sporulation protein YunB n=1 Tax=Paenibacillus macerans TaxID=44252 RepID=UPI002041E108|nr:sporulation protein YunB [Paenibacillus macerans]MCM3700787.1 sporulation protein YunB [Paenibacillus macerans]